MPVRRSRRTLRLENEMTALSVAHVNSARSNHRRGCNKLLGRICPSPQLGSCEGACCLRRSLLAPAPPVPPSIAPRSTATHTSVPQIPGPALLEQSKESSKRQLAGLQCRHREKANTVLGCRKSARLHRWAGHAEIWEHY